MTEATVRKNDDAHTAQLKRQLLARAGGAAGLIVVLLGGLAASDHLLRPPIAPHGPSAPAPEAMAASGKGAAGGFIAAPPAVAPADSGLRRDEPAEPEHTVAAEVAPAKHPADAPEPRPVLGSESASVRPDPPPAGGRPDAPPASGKAYVVQLGVFGSLGNAEALQARLQGLGIPARLESRVVVGPFPDPAAARAAQARLKEAGQDPGLIVPPRR